MFSFCHRIGLGWTEPLPGPLGGGVLSAASRAPVRVARLRFAVPTAPSLGAQVRIREEGVRQRQIAATSRRLVSEELRGRGQTMERIHNGSTARGRVDTAVRTRAVVDNIILLWVYEN